jgi:HK97 family phage major capsid protein
MKPVQLVESLRGFGYEGPVSKKSVEEFLTTDDAPELNLQRADGTEVTLDDVFATKGLTLTVTRNEDEPDTLNVVDGEAAEAPPETEMDDHDEDDEMKSLQRRIQNLEAKDGIAGSGLHRASSQDRWNATIRTESEAKFLYRRALKTGGVNPYTKKAPVFDDVDKAEVAGAWFRANAFGLYGRDYDQKSTDMDVLKGATTKGAILYDAGQGGTFAPPPEFRAELIELLDEYGTARRLCPFMPIPKEGVEIPRWDSDLAMSWATEAAADTDQDPATSKVGLYPKRLSGLMKISYDLLLADGVGMVDQGFRSFSRNAANKEDSAFFLGDGTSTYGGIVGIANALGSAGLKTSANNSWGAVTDAEVQDWMGLLAHYAWQNPPLAFTMTSGAFFSVLNRLNFAKGGVTYQEGSNGAVQFAYNGIPFVWNNVTQATSAANTNFGYFGSFGLGIKCGQAGTLEFRQSDQRYFDEYSLAIRVDEHVDINCHDLGDSSNAGPVVGIKTTT